MADARCFILVTFLTLLAAFSSSAERDIYRCPKSIERSRYLKTFGDQCYEFINQERYFDEAQRDCKSRDGNLVQIRDSLTQVFIKYSLRSFRWTRNGVWIGATDTEREGKWKWITGDRVLYSYWDVNEPSCKYFCSEDCAVLWTKNGGRWLDRPCHFSLYHYSYICQYQMLPPTTISTTSTTTSTTTMPSTTPTSTTTPTTTTTSTTATTTHSTTTSTTTPTPPRTTVTTSTTERPTVPPSSTVIPPIKVASLIQFDSPGFTLHYPKKNRSISTNGTIVIDIVANLDKSARRVTDHNETNKGGVYQHFYKQVNPAGHESNEETTNLQHHMLIGGVSGGVVVFSLILVIALILYRRRKSISEEQVYSVGFENPNYGQIKLRLGDDALEPVHGDESGSDGDENDGMLKYNEPCFIAANRMQNSEGFGTFQDPRV